MDFKGKKVLVIGLGLKTGVSAVRFLCKRGAVVSVVDQREKTALQASLNLLTGIDFILHPGSMDPALAVGQDLILLSPGVPRTIPLVKQALRENIEVIGDIELAGRVLDNPIIGLTGTDGKSTTTSMIGAILESSGKGRIAGNIGIPVLDIVDQVGPEEIIALELSSFQLESINNFKPVVAVILNLAADHLDRYPDMESYLNAKLQLFKNMDESCTAVLPLDDIRYKNFKKAVPDSVSLSTFAWEGPGADVFLKGESIVINGQPCINAKALKVRGRHNLRNALAATAVCFAAGLNAEEIKKGLLSFHGLAHRFEYVDTINGVAFINDSKATTISAVTTSVDSSEDRACMLLGGRDKGLDFSPLESIIRSKNIHVIPFGEARAKVREELSLDNKGYEHLEDAVRYAWQVCGDENRSQIVLAPGCTSYDEFPNFEVRGEFFKKIIATIRKEVSSD